MYACKWKIHIYIHMEMCTSGVWNNSNHGNSGVTNFIIVTENWCSHGCITDRLVDAHEQKHPDGWQSRQTC